MGGPLVIGQDEIGFHLSYTAIATKPNGQKLNWLVTAKLAELDPSSRSWKAVASKQVDKIEFPRQVRLSFPVTGKVAVYRVEVVFRNGAREKLARYGDYFRVLRPILDARLTLDRNTFYPGETVAPWLENHGTESLFYGLGYSIEVFDGSSWVRSPIAPSGIVPLIGLWTIPGGAASCWNFQVPPDAPPGLYRFVWRGNVTRNASLGQREPLTLTAEFQILP